MRTGCDWYFNADEYKPEREREIVYRVRSDPNLDYFEKKALLICWFDTTFGFWYGMTYQTDESRAKMSQFLKLEKYVSFESFLGINDHETKNANKSAFPDIS